MLRLEFVFKQLCDFLFFYFVKTISAALLLRLYCKDQEINHNYQEKMWGI